ncbi:hypothetical protein [Streptomyces sp. NPDC057545]|uniref:hypothetical protein n=1 Tax=Streptomyces sp. NPDC057545 TaxID=3346164 RepID=UPI0036CFE835
MTASGLTATGLRAHREGQDTTSVRADVSQRRRRRRAGAGHCPPFAGARGARPALAHGRRERRRAGAPSKGWLIMCGA